MGSGSSKLHNDERHLTQEQRDIRHLADRMAFGDRELQRIYRCYNRLLQLEQRASFLLDWALHSARFAAEERQKEELDCDREEEHKSLLQVMEQKILPIGFGNGLYRNCYMLPNDDTGEYLPGNSGRDGSVIEPLSAAETTTTTPSVDLATASATESGDGETTTTSTTTTTTFVVVDEYTRVARLGKFFDAASNCSGRRGNRVALTELVMCVSKSSSSSSVGMTKSDSTNNKSSSSNNNLVLAHHLVNCVYRMALACSFLSASKKDDEDLTQFLPNDNVSDHPALRALAQSMIDYAKKKRIRANPYGSPSPDNDDEEALLAAGWITKDDVLEWSETTAPLFSVVLPTLLHWILFPDAPFPPSRTSFDLPRIQEESCFFDHGSSPLLFSFGCLSPALRGTFIRLYTSISDGLSFNRLQNALMGYGGPTLLLIRETKGGLFGAFTASSWKEAKDFYGNSDCFLYQLLPTTAVYRPSGNDTNYMYCNSEARSRGYDGQSHGIGFGGTVDQPRLFLNEAFDECVASSQDLTFESGPLLPRTAEGGLRKKFEIESIEVWGVGGEEVVQEALGARSRAREIRDAAIRQSRKVDRASFLDDFRSGLIESKAFKYRDEIQGRADHDVDERNGKTHYSL